MRISLDDFQSHEVTGADVGANDSAIVQSVTILP